MLNDNQYELIEKISELWAMEPHKTLITVLKNIYNDPQVLIQEMSDDDLLGDIENQIEFLEKEND